MRREAGTIRTILTQVMEVIKRKAKKEWLESDKGVELVQVTEYIKTYKEIRGKQ